MEIKINSSYFQGDKTIMSGIMSSVDGDICHFTFGVPGDKSTLSDSDKVKALLDMIYSSLYPNRAEKEAISKIKLEINTLKEEALKEIKEETDKNREMVKMVTLIVNQYLISHEEELEEEEEDDDTGSSDDSEGSEEENRSEEEGVERNDN